MTARLGLFGGTFDPVHSGHVVLATEIREALALDKLFVVPAARSPHKPAGSGASAPLRLAMARAAFAGRDDVDVVDWEIARGAPSYTIDTLRRASELFSDASWTLVIGADSASDFPRWKDAAEISRLAEIVLAARPGIGDEALDRLRADLPGVRATLLSTTPMGVSSTIVRSRAARKLPLRGYVPDAVAKAIEESGLYAEG